MKNKILIFIGIITLSLSFLVIAPKTKAQNWYTPDLQDYTFNIPYDDTSLVFRANNLVSGNFSSFPMREYDFGVYQTITGALAFYAIGETLHWVATQSLLGSDYGLTPMSFNALPSYITYNIYNDYDPLNNKGAVNKHVIIYRLDFMGNYGMRIGTDIYDFVYSFEVIYQININYNNNNYVFNRGYKIHWYDRAYMEYFTTYTEMNSDLIQFELISRGEANYERGYTEGYDEGYDDGYDLGYNEGIIAGETEAYEAGFKAGEKSKLSKNTESFYNGIEKWLVPAIITVIVLGGIMSISALKRREQ